MTVSRRADVEGRRRRSWCLSPSTPSDVFGQAVATLVGNPPKELDGWLSIAADGTVTALTGKCEMGQGLYTAQTQLVAEELGVPMDRVKLIQCVTGTTPDQGVTSGAQSHPQNFNHANLALAAATAREALLQMASKQWGVPVDRLTPGTASCGIRTRTISYGELIGGRKFNLSLNPAAKRKAPREWTILGNPVKRLDMPEMVTGRFEYVHNVRVPGMVHGRVVRPPTVGATVASTWRRELRQRHARLHQGRGEEGFRRRRLREAVAGRSGGESTEGGVEARSEASSAGELLRSHAQAAEPRHVARRLERRRRHAREGGAGRALDVSASVSHARIDRRLVRRRGCESRQRDRLVADAGRVSAARQLRDGARHEAAAGEGDLRARLRLLRHQRRRHGFVRRRAAVAGRRPSRARAALAQRRDGARKLRPRVRRRSARRPRQRGQHHRVGLRERGLRCAAAARATRSQGIR